MKKIDVNTLMLDDMTYSQRANLQCYKNALKDGNGLFLGGLRSEALFHTYGEYSQLYELSFKFLRLLIKSECGYFPKVENGKLAHCSHDNELEQFYIKQIERELRGRELSEDDNNKDKEDNNMTDEEIYMKHVRIMYEEGIKALRHEYPQYDFDDDGDDLQKLYMDLYDELSSSMIQFSVNMNRIAMVNQAIDYHNILAEHEEDEALTDIHLENRNINDDLKDTEDHEEN